MIILLQQGIERKYFLQSVAVRDVPKWEFSKSGLSSVHLLSIRLSTRSEKFETSSPSFCFTFCGQFRQLFKCDCILQTLPHLYILLQYLHSTPLSVFTMKQSKHLFSLFAAFQIFFTKVKVAMIKI